MKIAIMQPYFFPYIGYYQAISAVDKFILYDDLAYIKKGWINKNRILIVNHEPTNIIVPVKNKSSYRKIKDIEVSDDKTWRKKMLNDIFYNYKKTLFFEDIYPIVDKVINSDFKYITDFNAKSIIDISYYLDIKTEIVTGISKYKLLEEKLEQCEDNILKSFQLIKIDKPDKKVIRILEICKEEKADQYINPIGGQELYSKKVFEQNGIKLFFVKTGEIVYPQQSKTFYPFLSIIDVLMNCGKAGTQKVMSQFDLI